MDGDRGEARVLSDEEIISLAPYTDTPEEPAPPRDEPKNVKLHFNINYDDIVDGDDDDDDDDDGPQSRSSIWKLVLLVAFIVVSAIFLIVQRVGHKHHNANLSSNKSHKLPETTPKAINWALDFPKLYPPVLSESEDCQSAWASLASVSCHEKIFNRGWDNSTHLSYFEPDPMRYVPLLCDPKCRVALEAASELITAACPAGASFNLEGYKGMFNTTFLEPGPVEAVDILLRRNTHTCRESKTGDSEYGSCMIELNERFFILDGMKFGTLEGIGRFLQATKRPKRESGGWKTGTRGSSSDGGWKQTYRFKAPERTYGPGINSTTCGWCMTSWFENKINAWEEGLIASPDSGLPVSLPEYIRRVREAGQRCEATEWNRIYDEAIKQYQDKKLLPEDWEGLPSGDLAYLIRKGPGRGDEPIASIRSAASAIREKHSAPSDNKQERLTLKCLDNLAAKIESLPCYIHLNDSTINPMIQGSNGLLSSYCGAECAAAIDQKDSLFVCGGSAIRRNPAVKPFLDAYEAARKTHSNVCVRQDQYDQQCAPVLLSLNLTSWAYTGRPDSDVFLDEISSRLAVLESTPIPTVVSDAIHKPWGTPEYASLDKVLPKWRGELKSGVCSPCIWQWVVGEGTTSTPLSYLRSYPHDSASKVATTYLQFAQDMYRICDTRGADWLGGLPYGDDEIVWRVFEQDQKVYRYIIEKDGFSGKGQWRRAEEETGQVSIPHHTWGSLWHLEAAVREFLADRDGVAKDWREYEMQHRAEEDAKVWKKGIFGDYSWIKPEDREKEAEKHATAKLKKPKRPLSAYILYANTVRDEVREANPGITFGELGRTLGEMWKNLPVHDRKVFEDVAAIEWDRYVLEKAAYDVQRKHDQEWFD